MKGITLKAIVRAGCIATALMTGTAHAQMYVCELGNDTILRMDLTGTRLRTVAPGDIGPYGIALDLEAGLMFWTAVDGDAIYRAALDGSNVTQLVTFDEQVSPQHIDVDPFSCTIYWAENHPGGADRIRRADYDGNNVQDLVTSGFSGLLGIEFDHPSGRLYWTDRGPGGAPQIGYYDTQGGGVETLLSGAEGMDDPAGIVVDHKTGRLYWMDNGGTLETCLPDGSQREVLLDGLEGGHGIALDPAGGRLYFSDFRSGTIRSCNLDGSALAVELVHSTGEIRDIAIIPGTRGLGRCWMDYDGNGVVDVQDMLFLFAQWGNCG